MQLRQNVDYSHLQGTFPVTTKRFENLGALSLFPHKNGLQIPVGHFLCNFIAPLSHQTLEMRRNVSILTPINRNLTA